MMDNESIFREWYNKVEIELKQILKDDVVNEVIRASIARISFSAGAKTMEEFMAKHFDNSINKKNFVKKHFWDLL